MSAASFGRRFVVGGRVRPGALGVEQRRLDAVDGNRHLEPEDRVRAGLGPGELAGDCSAHDGAADLDRHAAADAGAATGPAGVDQPDVDAVALDSVLEQRRVDLRRLREERGAEAGAERGLRLGDADLGTGHLGRVAGEEHLHRLLGRELGDGRQHAECVTGQHDDVRRLAGALLGHRVRAPTPAGRRRGCSRSASRRRGRGSRVSGSMTTFSSTVPNICVVA